MSKNFGLKVISCSCVSQTLVSFLFNQSDISSIDFSNKSTENVLIWESNSCLILVYFF